MLYIQNAIFLKPFYKLFPLGADDFLMKAFLYINALSCQCLCNYYLQVRACVNMAGGLWHTFRGQPYTVGRKEPVRWLKLAPTFSQDCGLRVRDITTVTYISASYL